MNTSVDYILGSLERGYSIEIELYKIAAAIDDFVNCSKFNLVPLHIIRQIIQDSSGFSPKSAARFIEKLVEVHGNAAASLIYDFKFKEQKDYVETFKNCKKLALNTRDDIFTAITNKDCFSIRYFLFDPKNANLANSDNETPIFKAVASGEIDTVKFLIKCGADVRHTSRTGSTCLHYASLNPTTEIAELLISYGCQVNKRGERYPIEYAIFDNSIEHVKLYINHRAILMPELLCLCCIYDRLEIFKLLEDLCPLTQKHEFLYLCSVNDSIDVMTYLLDNVQKYKLNVFQIQKDGKTIFGFAAEKGSDRCLAILAERYKSALLREDDIFNLAINSGNAKCVKILHENGFDVTSFSFYLAAKNGHYDIMEYFFDKFDGNYYYYDSNGYDGLLCSIYNNYVSTTKFFISHQLKISYEYLKTAIEEDKTEIVDLITDAVDVDSNHPLFLAARLNKKKMMLMLLKKGANPNVSENNECCLTYCIKHGTPKLAQLLLDYGADPCLFNKDQDLIPIVAAFNMKIDILKLILNYIDPKKLDTNIQGILFALCVKNPGTPISSMILKQFCFTPNLASGK
ncbi:hypothetical protein TVAG_062490 [Trichomonas vaginalis G3]|uniref:DUF3447 domain-containing protein n=1 Tax=Trichomonas vaginalis (strain ATCC PRA-98 / G3) TaxID=412133 RepID=A2DLL1_TRIV3|nr:protein ubiquitination [Trichomonas vaginalis G3]EAY18644.1 hypothetical protein TVAG_062490 [Trichomonas vaginalis G3]KAI5522529.1 protein ubiquitination [Trichomonas vaginalis G3]|eukprot:XP_001579630.1 hypothetical protein [Trichomonas vaginalis G3]